MLLFQHDIVVKTTVFFMQKYNTVHVCIVQNARWNTNVLSLNIAAILPCTSLYLHPIVAMHSMLHMQEIELLFQHDIVVRATICSLGKLFTICAYIAQISRWNKCVLFHDIAAILLYTALLLYPKVAMHFMLNIQEFQAPFSTQYCSESHFN